AAPGVGVEPELGLLDGVDQLAEAGDAPGATGGAADDVDDAGGDQAVVLLGGPAAFAGGDQRRAVTPQLLEALHVPRLERLFDPAQPVLLPRLRGARGAAHVPTEVLAAVEHDVGAGSGG